MALPAHLGGIRYAPRGGLRSPPWYGSRQAPGAPGRVGHHRRWPPRLALLRSLPQRTILGHGSGCSSDDGDAAHPVSLPRADVPIVQAAVSTPLAAMLRRRLISQLARNGSEPPADGDVGAWLADLEVRVENALQSRGTATGAQLSTDEPALRTLIPARAPSDRPQNVTSALLTLMSAEGRIVRSTPTGSWTSRHHRWECAGGQTGCQSPEWKRRNKLSRIAGWPASVPRQSMTCSGGPGGTRAPSAARAGGGPRRYPGHDGAACPARTSGELEGSAAPLPLPGSNPGLPRRTSTASATKAATRSGLRRCPQWSGPR